MALDTASDRRELDRKIDAAAWGIVFLWVGVALLAHVGWGVGLVGVGLITLGAQAWRNRAGLGVDRFSVVVGSLFVLFGIWSLVQVRVDIVPLLFIAAGIALLVSTWRRRASGTSGGGVDVPPHARV